MGIGEWNEGNDGNAGNQNGNAENVGNGVGMRRIRVGMWGIMVTMRGIGGRNVERDKNKRK